MAAQTNPTLLELLDRYEEQHRLMRKLVLPQEANRRLTAWRGGYRWFESANVICLEKVRLLRARINDASDHRPTFDPPTR